MVPRLNMDASDVIPDQMMQVAKALDLLTEIERIWPGARRSRVILDKLVQSPTMLNAGSQSSPLPFFEGVLWEDFPDTSAFVDGLLQNDRR